MWWPSSSPRPGLICSRESARAARHATARWKVEAGARRDSRVVRVEGKRACFPRGQVEGKRRDSRVVSGEAACFRWLPGQEAERARPGWGRAWLWRLRPPRASGRLAARRTREAPHAAPPGRRDRTPRPTSLRLGGVKRSGRVGRGGLRLRSHAFRLERPRWPAAVAAPKRMVLGQAREAERFHHAVSGLLLTAREAGCFSRRICAPRSLSSKMFAWERSTPATPHCSTTAARAKTAAERGTGRDAVGDAVRSRGGFVLGWA